MSALRPTTMPLMIMITALQWLAEPGAAQAKPRTVLSMPRDRDDIQQNYACNLEYRERLAEVILRSLTSKKAPLHNKTSSWVFLFLADHVPGRWLGVILAAWHRICLSRLHCECAPSAQGCAYRSNELFTSPYRVLHLAKTQKTNQQ